MLASESALGCSCVTSISASGLSDPVDYLEAPGGFLKWALGQQPQQQGALISRNGGGGWQRFSAETKVI